MTIDLAAILRPHLQKILATTATEPLQKLLGEIAENAGLQPLELAACLMYLDTSVITSCKTALEKLNLQASTKAEERYLDIGIIAPQQYLTAEIDTAESAENALKKQLVTQLATALDIPEILPEKYKMVRYRIEIGHNHQVSIEEIKNVLINESGVDRNKIGNLEIRSNYTLIDLPPGMPPDIFQLLQTVELKQQALQIKRVNSSRKRPWQRRKSGAQNRPVERESSQSKDTKQTL